MIGYTTTGDTTATIDGRADRALGEVVGPPVKPDRRRVHVVMEESAQARILQVYGPFYERLGDLFNDYTPDEIAVQTDWFTRPEALFQETLDEIGHGVSNWPESGC